MNNIYPVNNELLSPEGTELFYNPEESRDDTKTRCINIAGQVQNIRAEIEAIKAAEDAMYKRRKDLEMRVETYRKELYFWMGSANIKEIRDSPYYVIKMRRNSPSADIINESLIPTDYVNVVETRTINKRKLIEDLKQGLYIEGAMLKYSTSVVIT